MVPTTEILRALFDAGYLKESNIESARPIITAALRDEELVAARAEVLRDETQQEQMISGARLSAENDALIRDKEELNIDKSIIWDATGKEKQDKASLSRTDKMISKACESAAKKLAHARLIDKSQVKGVAGVIRDTWIESSS